MIKTIIELVYQTLFNFFVKRDGYNSLTHILASLLTFGVFFLITTNVLFVINIFSNDAISLPQNKGLVWLISLMVGGVNYFFLFSILKLEKEGNGESKVFNIDPKKSNGILRILTVLAICWFLSAAIEIIF